MAALDIDERRFGSDIRVSLDPDDDNIQVTPTGDLPMDTGRANLHEAIRRRIQTLPGAILFRPTYGAGVVSFVEAVGTPAARAALENQIRRNLLEDDRVSDASADAAAGTTSDERAASTTLSVSIKAKKDSQSDTLSLSILE